MILSPHAALPGIVQKLIMAGNVLREQPMPLPVQFPTFCAADLAVHRPLSSAAVVEQFKEPASC